MKQSSSQYFLLTIFLILLSVAGYAGLNWLKSQPSPRRSLEKAEVTPTSNIQEPGSSIQEPISTTIPTSSIQDPGSNIQEITSAPVVPTPAFKSFTSPTDNFSVTYSSSRKLYQDAENNSINRYTFYRNDSNFAIHVGRETWAWEHPNRDFSGNFLVSGQNTFRFETAGQTIVDIDKNGLKYTIQCIHGNQSAVISECDSFLKSFKLN
ncbi:MAG: hypothetical protein WCV93_05480 [Candidatus Shapirobacteria bacterium]|jgi:hypothetical protein